MLERMPATSEPATRTAPPWSASGLLFENCNCQLVCPGHMGFKQLCTHARCVGHWSIHVDEGRFGETALDGLNAVILYDTPQHMISGGWTEAFYLDERADEAQRRALEAILSGAAGGPWSVLARFVAKRLETRFVPLRFEDAGRKKRMAIEGVFETAIEAIRGQDKEREAALENVFNQIHAPRQVLARGFTRCSDRGFSISNDDSHAIWSRFSWKVG
jgi:hypothetical protein